MLDKQYHLYSVDTGLFFSNREKYLYDQYCKYRGECRDRKREASKDQGMEPSDWEKYMKHKRAKAKEAKEKLLALLSHKVAQNELTDGKDHIRTLKAERLKDTHVISAFDSALSRTIGIREDELTEVLIVVQIYHFDVFKDICFYGFTYKGEKYRYYTSSAGQIRKKKALFMKEATWNSIKSTVMCGLTWDQINLKGGINVNKYLAYMALNNSATDEWKEFDIDRSIVIDDFETNVYGTFDHVDEKDYTIARKTDYVPIPHTDGAGMVLPSVSGKNFMFRAPWIKGLLGVFDFRKFIDANDCSPVIKDIYGKEHHIIEEDIRIIFTKSQFKMHRYYDSWEQYKEYFKKYRCTAGRCHMEEDRIKNAKINYQMLQTLTDITDEEMELLTRKSAERISNVCSSRETMLDILGVTPYNRHMTPFQKALKLYPALLNDTYSKDVLRDVKNSLLKKYRSGKLEVTGKYTYLLPDFYAACEYWFGHVKEPMGLLADGEVFCQLWKRYPKLDCLRSPHLYKEHAIRTNAAYDKERERAGQLREWFCTNALYTSTHDLISKILQFDVDGDLSLVVADPELIKVAERNMEGIVPLYYNMRKAEPTALDAKAIYAGLIKAFTGESIGSYSNDIAKIWNHDVFINGTDKEKQEALDVVKLLCMENNFAIDAAKTLYMPTRPKWFDPVAAKYTKDKLPAFFAYAKDKEESQIRELNASLVNRLSGQIPNKPIDTKGLELGEIRYQDMMANQNMVCSKEVSALYDELNRQYRYMINMKDEYIDNLRYVACRIREDFRNLGYLDETVTDMLVAYLYGKNKRYKQLLWFCYGQYIVNNLEKNLDIPKTKYIQCMDCGEWVEVAILNRRACRCERCKELHDREYERMKKQRQRRRK